MQLLYLFTFVLINILQTDLASRTGRTLNAIDTNIAGGGDQIRLIGHTRDKMTISEGDRIQVVGAIAIPNVEYIDEMVNVSPGWRDIRTGEMVDVENYKK